MMPSTKNILDKLILQKNSSRISKLLQPTTTVISSRFSTSAIEDDQHHHEDTNNPLIMLKKSSQRHRFCDEDGYRKNGSHWTFAISIPNEQYKAPVLRTVNFQRVSHNGIDFIMKNRGYASDLLFTNDPHKKYLSILYTTGKYLPGQKVTQWRAQGSCHPLRLAEIIPHYYHRHNDAATKTNKKNVPNNTVIEMIASVRANKEGDSGSDIMDVSHIVDLVQQTRIDFENGDISTMELEEAVRGWRFVPNQIEKMVGSPDQVMWDRKEWVRSEEEGGGNWEKPNHLMPF